MINLLSQELKQERTMNRKFRHLLIFFGVLTVLALTTWGSVLYVESSLQAKNRSLDNEISAINTDLIKYRDLEKDINSTNGRLGQIDTIVASRPKWSEIIAKLANHTPLTIQINNLQLSPEQAVAKNSATGYQLVISGTAKTLEDIELYRKTLDDSDLFSNSLFKSANLNQERNNFTFGLTTLVKMENK